MPFLNFLCLEDTQVYTVFYKKDPFFVFFIIHLNDDQFTQNLNQL